jgi:hypothetical protein
MPGEFGLPVTRAAAAGLNKVLVGVDDRCRRRLRRLKDWQKQEDCAEDESHT